VSVHPDDDKTVIFRPTAGLRPTPGRLPAAEAQTAPPVPEAVPVTGPVPAPGSGPMPGAAPMPVPGLVAEQSAASAINVSALITAASPLLQLLARLRAMRHAPNPQALRNRVAQDLGAFERRAREMDISMELLRPAHYVLCASIDDVVLNTPWGAASGWATQTLMAAFHHGSRGVDQVFEYLRQMQTEPGKFLPVIELIYLCLSLGFMGRYRDARGGGELERLRNEAYAAITAQHPAAEAELSRHWRGVTVPYRPGQRGVPVWVALAGAVALCGGLLFWTSVSLNAASDGLLTHVLAIPPARMPQIVRLAVVAPPPPVAPPEPTALDRLRAVLQPAIDGKMVDLLGTPATPIIRITDPAIFAPGSATIRTASLPLLGQVSAALRNEAGPLQVIDYTDNRPIRTVQFPSNFQLSKARADAVRTALTHDLGDPARLRAEGRADADPIAPNTTQEGRAQNERVEIVLRRAN
jgi:type VI secretion system protein ImpK